jgi:RimJ/RimL family protein N-acetyltransferase
LNRRAQRVWQKLGFRPAQTFTRRGDGLVFSRKSWRDWEAARITGPTSRL